MKCYFWKKNKDCIWNQIQEQLKSIIPDETSGIKIEKKDLTDGNISDPDKKILIFPLFDIEPKSGQIIPVGLHEVLKIYLNNMNNTNFHSIFIVHSKNEIPDIFYPVKDMPYYVMRILRNPRFGEVEKAVFSAELVYEKHDRVETKIVNVIDLLDKGFLEKINSAIEKLLKIDVNWKKEFYKTYIGFYSNFCELETSGTFNLNRTVKVNDKNLAADDLNLANKFYDITNGISIIDETRHHVPLELFRAPLPFPLQDLFDAIGEVEEELRKGSGDKKIQLLLIDNRIDKIVREIIQDGEVKFENGGLINVLFEQGYCDKFFELRMLGNRIQANKNDQVEIPETLEAYDRLEEKECIKFGKFKTSLHKLKSLEKENYDKEKSNHYSWQVYDRIRESNFILLDFFLNEENTYLAFDFIKDIAEIKRKEGDPSTTWYFITSAVYDSVVKYSQSGLLAEYYESAVVNAGDDPTNEKRQIIFVYKLLTFIQARIRSFKRYSDIIFYRILGQCSHKDIKNRIECCVKIPDDKCNNVPREARGDKECKKDSCLEYLQTSIKRYLTEFDNIASLFYDEGKISDYKRIVELLDDTITKFLLMPEADWQIIQHQIDYINARIEEVGDKGRFSCSYILDEIINRSEIF
ncbi:MAG: hypothetical protein HQ551_07070 [Desulfobacteraceae bacterium]|nr:hypothetical protein [Desulfobacteraceae bacterium]